MDLATLLTAIGGVIAAALATLVVFTHAFKGWKAVDELGLLQAVFPFAAAAVALNALFNGDIADASKIVAAAITLAAAIVALLKQAVATEQSIRDKAREANPNLPPDVSVLHVAKKFIGG